MTCREVEHIKAGHNQGCFQVAYHYLIQSWCNKYNKNRDVV